MTSDLQDATIYPTPTRVAESPKPAAPTLRAALAELSLASTLVLAQVDGKELLNSWQSKPDTKRLLAALELAREALSQ